MGSYLVIGVLPDYQGRNVASTLTYLLFKEFDKKNIQQVETATNINNQHTNQFWLKKGGVYTHTEGGHKYYLLPVKQIITDFEKNHVTQKP